MDIGPIRGWTAIALHGRLTHSSCLPNPFHPRESCLTATQRDGHTFNPRRRGAQTMGKETMHNGLWTMGEMQCPVSSTKYTEYPVDPMVRNPIRGCLYGVQYLGSLTLRCRDLLSGC